MPTIKEQKRFTIRVKTNGNLLSNFVFENNKAFKKWKRETLPILEEKYGKLILTITPIPGLVVGDECHVIGEGSDVFVIERLIQYSPHRYGFVLNVGWCEEVAKCF